MLSSERRAARAESAIRRKRATWSLSWEPGERGRRTAPARGVRTAQQLASSGPDGEQSNSPAAVRARLEGRPGRRAGGAGADAGSSQQEPGAAGETSSSHRAESSGRPSRRSGSWRRSRRAGRPRRRSPSRAPSPWRSARTARPRRRRSTGPGGPPGWTTGPCSGCAASAALVSGRRGARRAR